MTSAAQPELFAADDNVATRRRFLIKASGLGALGVTAALAGASPAAGIAANLQAPESPTSGYRESAHIKTYYRTARYW